MKKLTLRMLFLLVLTVVIASASVMPVAEAAGGDIYSDVNRKIVGIWMEVENGNSGWAWMAENHTYMTEWNYDTQGKRWKIHVGLGSNGGGTDWDWTVSSGWRSEQSSNLELVVRSGFPATMYIWFR